MEPERIGRLDHLGRKRARVAEGIGSGRALADAVELRLSEFRSLARDQAPDGLPVRGPDFIIFGAPKCGTSWLIRALKEHGGVFAPRGEMRYFSHALDRPVAEYVAELSASVRPDAVRPIVGEKSPQYLIMDDERIRLCAMLFPKVKLVCMVRDPVERAWSHLRHSRASRYELPFLQTRASGVSFETIVSFGFFARHLRRWARWFPSEQFLLIDHHRVMTEPEAVFRETLEFLGAPVQPLDPRVPVEATAFAPMPPELRAHLEALYAGEAFRADELRRMMFAETAPA
jgi:hypothetical protein